MSDHFKKITLPINLIGLTLTLGFCLGFFDLHLLIYTLIGWILICGFGIAVGFHKLLSHNSFKTFKIIEKVISYLGCLGGQGSPIFWVAVHRGLHHPYADTNKDIHSPVKGYFNSYIGWQINIKPTDVPFRYATDLLRQPFQVFLHRHYMKVFYFSALAFLLISRELFFFGFILPAFISLQQENTVDLVCHLRRFGYRNFNTNDNSVNNPVLGVLGFGQGWHNNHHAQPNNYNYGHKWYEIDPGKFLVWLIQK